MSTQYGFFIDSARCTGCKTCELACKDYKNLTPEVSFRRIYESVWLDKESVLFGDSTLALRQWMRENGIALEADGNEPEDHFGTVLLLAAWLCETEQDALFAQLLAWHLLPWSGRFLSVFVDHAAHPFYQALGQLAQATLAQWQENLPIAVAQKPLYR